MLAIDPHPLMLDGFRHGIQETATPISVSSARSVFMVLDIARGRVYVRDVAGQADILSKNLRKTIGWSRWFFYLYRDETPGYRAQASSQRMRDLWLCKAIPRAQKMLDAKSIVHGMIPYMSNVIDFQPRQKPAPKESEQAETRIEELEAELIELRAFRDVVSGMALKMARSRHPSSVVN